MHTVRRTDHSPRVEMMPLIDVVFLLLTFFIYSLIVMRYTNTLNVQFTPVGTGQAAEGEQVNAITIDKAGRLFFNQQLMTPDALNAKLDELAAAPDQPPLYLAMEADGEVDRGPIYIDLLERVRSAGIANFVIVGQPKGATRP